MNEPYPSPEAARLASLLRDRVLALSPQELNLDPTSVSDPWGVLVEVSLPQTSSTLVALADGSVSIYCTDGHGTLGGGADAQVRRAVHRVMQIATRFLPQSAAAATYPLPDIDWVHFYFLTRSGVRVCAAPLAEMVEGGIDLAELYYAAYALAETLELSETGHSIEDEIRQARGELRSSSTGSNSRRGSSIRNRVWQIFPYAGNAGRRSRR